MGTKKTTKTTRRRRFGTILKREHRGGRVVYRARWSEGRTGKRRERLFDSEKEARTFLKGIHEQVLRGTYVTPPTVAEVERGQAPETNKRPTLVEYAEQLLTTRLEAVRADATIDLYRANLKALKAFYGRRKRQSGEIPAKRLDEITEASFLDYRAFRKTLRHGGIQKKGKKPKNSKPVSVATMNRDQQFLSLVLSQAVIDGLIEHNPLAGLKPLKEPRKPRRWLTKKQVRALLDVCEDQFRPFVLAMLYTGCRPIELRGLTWADVNFETGKLSFYRSKVGNSDELDMHPVLERELRTLREAHGDAAGPKSAVFLNRYGRPWKDMTRAWKRTTKAAGLDGLVMYSLRHTFATHFLDDGGAATDLKAQLGHSELTTTQRYADLVSKRRRKTVRGMDYEEERDDADGVAEFSMSWDLCDVS